LPFFFELIWIVTFLIWNEGIERKSYSCQKLLLLLTSRPLLSSQMFSLGDRLLLDSITSKCLPHAATNLKDVSIDLEACSLFSAYTLHPLTNSSLWSLHWDLVFVWSCSQLLSLSIWLNSVSLKTFTRPRSVKKIIMPRFSQTSI
jgi:hypothetical protein